MRGTLLALSLVASLALTGCGGPEELQSPVTSSQIRGNISPTLDSTATTDEQDVNTIARSIDMDIRMFRDDFMRFFMLDRTSRLHGTPVY
ncbi:MAG: hypothetical protein RLN76_11015 [Phycisphaeraceae bacterium]